MDSCVCFFFIAYCALNLPINQPTELSTAQNFEPPFFLRRVNNYELLINARNTAIWLLSISIEVCHKDNYRKFHPLSKAQAPTPIKSGVIYTSENGRAKPGLGMGGNGAFYLGPSRDGNDRVALGSVRLRSAPFGSGVGLSATQRHVRHAYVTCCVERCSFGLEYSRSKTRKRF